MSVDRYVEVCSRLKALIVRELELRISPESIPDYANLFWEGESGDGLSLDSIEALTLIVCIEGEFGVQIPEEMDETERLRVFDSIASLSDYIVGRLP